MRFHDRLLGPRWRSHHGHQALVDGVVAPLRPCAARAALREQARSYICFGPVMSVPLSGPPCLFGLEWGQGRQVHGWRYPAPLRPCAPPAPTSVSGQLCLCHCLDRLVDLAGDWVRASMCMPWFFRRPRDRAPPARRFPGKPGPTSVSGQLCLCHCLDRLVVWLGIGSGRPSAWLDASGTLETVRRPRGASRMSVRLPVPPNR